MKNNVLKYYIAAFYFCSTMVLFAQPGDGSNGDPLEGDGDTTPGAPIDDYVWVLAIVGLFFVFMKFRGLVQQKSLQK
jgi:hypothetical protein